MSGTATRAQIIEAADQLFYRHGYEHTSFADIANAVQISRGNFYYHFKTKNEILDAVIDARLAGTRQMLAGWEAEEAEPAGRIKKFIHIVLTNQADIKNYGCPVGTLTAELAKLHHAHSREASALPPRGRPSGAVYGRARPRHLSAPQVASAPSAPMLARRGA